MLLIDAFEPPAPRQWIVNSVTSYHVGDRKMNETNPGTGFERELSESATVSFGHYLNSHSRQSVYAGMQWTPFDASRVAGGNLRTGLVTGVVSGYTIAPIVPMFGVVTTWDDKYNGFNLMLVPNPVNLQRSFFGLQMKRRMP